MKKAKEDYFCAVNGLEALQIFKENPLSFKLIFMGMSLAQHIR
jgi:hypothetical protein